MFVIEVVEISSGNVVKQMETESESKAERIESALLSQSNLEDFYINIREE